MELYLVLVDDRHDDVTAHAFSKPEVAVYFARQHYEDNVPDDLGVEELRESGIGVEPVDGFLFHAVYSTEGDSVWVAPVVLDAAVPVVPSAGGRQKVVVTPAELLLALGRPGSARPVELHVHDGRSPVSVVLDGGETIHVVFEDAEVPA